MKRGLVKLSDFRSPLVRWGLFGIFGLLFVVDQIVTVVPSPHSERDSAIFSLGTGGIALAFLWLAVSFHWKRRRWRERLANGKCTLCGYDLRATPDRCPECGTVPPKLEAKI
jgi:peptidoglycan/LPS O-acetylase OafA/YrhL